MTLYSSSCFIVYFLHILHELWKKALFRVDLQTSCVARKKSTSQEISGQRALGQADEERVELAVVHGAETVHGGLKGVLNFF